MPTPTAYYNENDPKATAWLRELILRGHIAPGDVDERSIADVHPADLLGYDQCHFFAGIGGWSYALRLAGWPDDRPVWTGSCPCQPFSVAGKGLGTADARHLWPEFQRLIAECRPASVFGEQVASKPGREWLAGVRADLEALGYAVGAADLCAAGVGAPHIRQRLYWMADADLSGQHERTSGRKQPLRVEHIGAGWMGDADIARPQGWGIGPDEHADQRVAGAAGIVGGMADTEHTERGSELKEHGNAHGRQGFGGRSAWGDSDVLPCTDGKSRRVESGTFPLAHGVPARMGRLRGYGNAIVPQVAAEFILAAA